MSHIETFFCEGHLSDFNQHFMRSKWKEGIHASGSLYSRHIDNNLILLNVDNILQAELLLVFGTGILREPSQRLALHQRYWLQYSNLQCPPNHRFVPGSTLMMTIFLLAWKPSKLHPYHKENLSGKWIYSKQIVFFSPIYFDYSFAWRDFEKGMMVIM